MAAPLKKPKLELNWKSQDELTVFIAPQRINKIRLDKMKETAFKKGMKTADKFSYAVTRLVTDVSDKQLVIKNFNIKEEEWVKGHEIVNTSWFSECIQAGHPVEVLDKHRVGFKDTNQRICEPVEEKKELSLPGYACQRSTPFKHHNEKFTKALEVLELHAELRNDPLVKDYTRALAFRRAACVLKCLPKPLRKAPDLHGLKDVGSHAERVIKDILENGYSAEVEGISSNEEFKTWKLFDGVFGIGPSTAKTWFEQGYRTIEDIIQSSDALRRNDKRVQYGLAFYDELNSPVPRRQAERIKHIVTEEANKILPGVTVELTGGFRRGKPSGHDVDLLFSHPENGSEKGLLPKLLQMLQRKNLILFGKHEEHANKSDSSKPTGTLDDFEKWIGIFKLPVQSETDNEMVPLDADGDGITGLDDLVSLARSKRKWTACRVDLVVTPIKQYFYALVGWTGSKQFNRSVRLYAQRELHMKLTSHGLYDASKIGGIPARSEREVFDNIKLTYREPWERNC